MEYPLYGRCGLAGCMYTAPVGANWSSWSCVVIPPYAIRYGFIPFLMLAPIRPWPASLQHVTGWI